MAVCFRSVRVWLTGAIRNWDDGVQQGVCHMFEVRLAAARTLQAFARAISLRLWQGLVGVDATSIRLW